MVDLIMESQVQNSSEKMAPVGYKLTEVGVIPEDWDVFSLPEIIWYQEVPGLRKWQFKSNGLKVINVTNLQDNGHLKLDRTDRHISWDEYEKNYKHFMCEEGDLVIASSGNSYCKTSIVRACDLPLLMNTSVIRFKPLSGFSKTFMDVYLKSPYFKEQIDLLITGGAQPNFGPAHLNKIKIISPKSKKEQKTIGETLSDIDTLIIELEKLIAKKQTIKTATMQQLLTGKTRLPHFSFLEDGSVKGYKKSEVGDIPEDWHTSTILDIVTNIIDYRGRTPKKLGMDWGNGNIVALSAGNVKKGYIDFSSECYFGSEDLYNRWMTSGTPKKDDIVFTMEAPLGNAALIPDDKKYILSQRTILLQINEEKFTSIFILQVFLSDFFQSYIYDCATGSTAQGIKRSVFEKLYIAAPKNREEQTAIAAILSDMDKEIQALQQRLDKTRQLKQGMMQELLTGKTRLI